MPPKQTSTASTSRKRKGRERIDTIDLQTAMENGEALYKKRIDKALEKEESEKEPAEKKQKNKALLNRYRVILLCRVTQSLCFAQTKG